MSILQHESTDPRAESIGPLFGIALAAFVAYWVATPAIYQLASGRSLVPATQATSTDPAQINPRDLVALSIAAPIVGILVLTIGNALWIKRPFEKLGLTFARLRDRGWMIGIISAAVVVPLIFGVVWVTQEFWDWINYAHPSEHDLLRVLGAEPSRAVRTAIAVSAVALAPVFEEFFFRGMIQRALKLTLRSRWGAILIASIAFTAVHGALWLAPPIFVLSLCLGYLYDRTTNLWVPMIVHAAFNATSIVMFLFFR